MLPATQNCFVAGPCQRCGDMTTNVADCDRCLSPAGARPLPSQIVQRLAREEREIAEYKANRTRRMRRAA